MNKLVPVLLVLFSLFFNHSVFSQDENSDTEDKLMGYIQRGFLYFETGEMENGIAVLDSAITEFPNIPMLYILKGEAYLNFNEYFSNDQKAYLVAMNEFNKALEIAPEYFPAVLSKAKLNYLHQRHDEAIPEFEKALTLASNDDDRFKVHNDLGGVYLHLNNQEKVQYHFNKALEIKPDSFGVLTNLAIMYMNNGNYSESEKLYQRAIALEPNQSILYSNFGLMYILKGDLAEASIQLDKAIEIDPSSPFPYNNKGLLKIKEGKTEEALTLIEKSMSIYPDNSWAFKHRAMAYFTMGKKELACKDLHTANDLGYTTSYDNEVNDLIVQYDCK